MLFYRPNYLMMTAGPTTVSGNALHARSKVFGNPDLDPDFLSYYKFVCHRLRNFIGSEESKILIMSGEGMLGLDAACASLTEKGDKVLVISNGFFGEGFKELIEPYGGNVTIFESSWKKSIDLESLKSFLEKDSDFKYATIIHCDTPSGLLNDIGPVCQLLKSKGILTVVDTVAALGGVDFRMDEWGVDIALSASQKVFSAAPGLTIVAVSDDAWKAMENRSTPIPSFYCNLLHWKNIEEKKSFPYTMPASDIISLGTAIDNLLSETLYRTFDRHEEMRDLCIERLKELGCTLYLEDNFSPTVTAFYPPEGIRAEDLLVHLRTKYNILLSGSYGPLAGKVIRIGHMGENAREDRVRFTLDCLEKAIIDLK
ncbi:MAG: pyridoxal-phosphate-dependent aminotransferase family protein [Cetobacterium sp.]|uniref:pyridoxal-phosphate-dependent aminotransferase family protein n=1 Tax=unclassified Cetobacterium TaxID=2630983 RepID=UPI000647545D|nr:MULTISPECIES: alanine--glyoxylate aminotransferase family protein [unclassified Cetobacterium]